MNKKLSYHRETMRYVMSVEVLSNGAQLYAKNCFKGVE